MYVLVGTTKAVLSTEGLGIILWYITELLTRVISAVSIIILTVSLGMFSDGSEKAIRVFDTTTTKAKRGKSPSSCSCVQNQKLNAIIKLCPIQWTAYVTVYHPRTRKRHFAPTSSFRNNRSVQQQLTPIILRTSSCHGYDIRYMRSYIRWRFSIFLKSGVPALHKSKNFNILHFISLRFENTTYVHIV